MAAANDGTLEFASNSSSSSNSNNNNSSSNNMNSNSSSSVNSNSNSSVNSVNSASLSSNSVNSYVTAAAAAAAAQHQQQQQQAMDTRYGCVPAAAAATSAAMPLLPPPPLPTHLGPPPRSLEQLIIYENFNVHEQHRIEDGVCTHISRLPPKKQELLKQFGIQSSSQQCLSNYEKCILIENFIKFCNVSNCVDRNLCGSHFQHSSNSYCRRSRQRTA